MIERRETPIGHAEAKRRLYEMSWRHDLMMSGQFGWGASFGAAPAVLDEVRSLEDTLSIPEAKQFQPIGSEPRRYRGRPEDLVRIAA